MPELASAWPVDPWANHPYCEANSDSDRQGLAIRQAIAEYEGVSWRNLKLTGSLLNVIENLPRRLHRRKILKLQRDFVGYGRGIGRDIHLAEIPVPFNATDVDPAIVSEAVRGHQDAMLFVTFSATNPGQQRTSLELVKAAWVSNPDLIIAIDNAYRGKIEVPGLAAYASTHERVIYLQTASKDLGVCGDRVGWMIASPTLLARAKESPFPANNAALQHCYNIIRDVRNIAKFRQTQAETCEILLRELKKLNIPTISGPGPWVLIHLGPHAAEVVVADLAKEDDILVQLQTASSLKGWVRISATAPCEAAILAQGVSQSISDVRQAERIANRVKALLQQSADGAWARTLSEHSDEWPLDELLSLA